MSTWTLDLPEPPDYAREVVEAIARDDSHLAQRAEAVLAEIEATIVQINEVTGNVVGRLHQDRQLIQQLARRFAESRPAAPGPVETEARPAAVEVELIEFPPNGSPDTENGAVRGGLSDRDKLSINDFIERTFREHPDMGNEKVKELALISFSPVLVTSVSQPGPTVGSMIYRIRRRLERDGVLAPTEESG